MIGDGAEILAELANESSAAWFLNEALRMVEFGIEVRTNFVEAIHSGVRSIFDYFRDASNPFFPGGPTFHNIQHPEDDNDDDYCVNFKLNLNNQTEEDLGLHQIQVTSGWTKRAIVRVMAGEEQSMHGRHLSDTATGCVGSVAWSIGKTGKILAVMYSVPYDQNLYR